MITTSSPCLGLFAKFWQTGKVKTRLGQTIGDERAATVYRSFLETLIARFQPTVSATASLPDGVIVYSPENRESDFRTLIADICGGPAWQLRPQGDGDLGRRLQRFFAASFQEHTEVVVIGTDRPTLPRSYLHQAFSLLKSHDAVIGPCDDGGYYLIGLSKRCGKHNAEAGFNDVDWSTEHVCGQTIRNLQNCKAKLAALPSWYDVDTIDELQRLKRELQSHDEEEAVDSTIGSLA